MPSPRRSPLHRLFAALTDNIVRRVVLYYALLFGGAALVWPHVPPSVRQALLKSYAPNLDFATVFTAAPSKHDVVAAPIVEPVALSVAGAATAAFLLALPVAWIYMLTRERKGYRQSVVHTLVLLPVVVAGVVVLVKTSVALAFSLAGIVAGVRFRSTLPDARDAVFVFLAIGVGLAAGVQAMTVALILSVAFNFILLTVWRSDFGRTVLEPTPATRWVEPLRTLADANGTSHIADRDLLLALSPKKAAALAERFERVRDLVAGENGKRGKKPRFNAVLWVTTEHVRDAQMRVERVLNANTRRWQLDEVETNTGKPSALYYLVRVRKSLSPDELLTAIRAEGGQYVLSAELETGDAVREAAVG
jgi:hypothetical protein